MKLIDRTPFLGPDGRIPLLDRLRGTLQFGFNWYPELEAQRVVLARLQKHLDKFTLIRNLTLGRSGITIPFILIGPPGVYVLYVTHLKGVYQARGDAWGQLNGERFQPSSTNLLTRTARMGRAVSVFLQRQGLEVGTVETALLAADPGMQIESVRPIVRVVMSDGIERFAQSLAQARPTLTIEKVHQLTDRLLEPLPPASVARTPQPSAPPPDSTPPAFDSAPAAPEAEAPAGNGWDAGSISFAFGEEQPAAAPADSEPGARMRHILAGAESAPPPAVAPRAVRARPRRRRGLSRRQLLLLAFMGLFELLLLVVFFVLLMNG